MRNAQAIYNEQRLHPRYSIATPCTIRIGNFSYLFGSIQSISRGGAFINTQTRYPRTSIQISTTLLFQASVCNEGYDIEINCKVVRITDSGIRVAFDVTGTVILHQFIDKLESFG